VESPIAIISVCAFVVAIPILSVYWLLAYATKLENHLDWVENLFIVGVAISLVGFGAALLQVSFVAAGLFVIAIITSFLLVLAAAQGWGRPKPPPPGWKPTYTPRNDPHDY
jgi:hypothetical protein